MKKIAIIGFLLILAMMPLVQLGFSSYGDYLRENEQQEIAQHECDNTTICLGGFGGRIYFPEEYLKVSLAYLLSGAIVGSIGAIITGKNWRHLIETDSLDK